MNINLIAYMKKYNDFILNYKAGDEKKLYNGKSLLFYSLANNDVESRYSISTFLLDKGIDVSGLNEENENVLHVLLSRTNHNLKQTYYEIKSIYYYLIYMCQSMLVIM